MNLLSTWQPHTSESERISLLKAVKDYLLEDYGVPVIKTHTETWNPLCVFFPPPPRGKDAVPNEYGE